MNDSIEDLCAISGEMARAGFALAGGGNVSIRHDSGFAVSGSGTNLSNLTPDDFVFIATDRQTIYATRNLQPSKEWPFHREAYERRESARCVLHFHPPFTIAATTRLPDGRNTMPVMTPYFVIRVHGVEQVPYEHPGSPELARSIGTAVGASQVVLLKNHGVVAVGRTISEARAAVEATEENARLYLIAGPDADAIPSEKIHELRVRYWKDQAE